MIGLADGEAGIEAPDKIRDVRVVVQRSGYDGESLGA
jgi:hypothetical protein